MMEVLEACSRWLSAATPSGFGCKEKCGLHPARGARIVGRVVVRWCRRSRSSTTGYRLRCLRHLFRSKHVVYDRKEYRKGTSKFSVACEVESIVYSTPGASFWWNPCPYAPVDRIEYLTSKSFGFLFWLKNRMTIANGPRFEVRVLVLGCPIHE